MIENKKIQILAEKYLQGRTTADEEAILHAWYESKGQDNEEIVVITDGDDAEKVKSQLYNKIKLKRTALTDGKHDNRGVLWSHAAVAAIFLCFTTVAIYFYTHQESPTEVRYTELLANDIGPGGNNAILELADGTQVNLDAVNVGKIANSGDMQAVKSEEGILSFQPLAYQAPGSIRHNTIRTPKGGQYQVELPDGTKVWLNASSSIRFSSSFSKELREVELEGEAYFEVARLKNSKGQRVPFVVKSSKQLIEVLGTHFNVSSYPEDDAASTVLLEGSVRVVPKGAQSPHVLKPGQGSTVDDKSILIDDVDLGSALAWKNGDFVFDNENLSSVMKKLERWYDIDVEYNDVSKYLKFSGAVSRSKNLSAVLKIMELTGNVKFKIEGRRIIVMT